MSHEVAYTTLTRLEQTTLSALQLHPWALIVVDEDATAGMSHLPI